MTLRFIISGTDTGIGKTVFSAALASALDAYYWKPIQSGLEDETDSETVKRLGNLQPERVIPEAWKLHTPVSPHLAARLDNTIIQPELLIPPQTSSPLIIEGCGGLMVPLTNDFLLADLFARWQIPVILCARTSLGTINHTLLSLEALRIRSIPVYGVVFIGPEQIDTQNIIVKLGKTRMLGRLPWLDLLTPDHLQQMFLQQFSLSDFQRLAA